MIIGLTGTLGAGKDTVADYLKKRGFSYYSLSDILRDECQRRGLMEDRDNLAKIGNELRVIFGPGILAERISEKINDDMPINSLVVSIRHPKEVEELKKKENFVLINVDAPIEIRYQRIKQRQEIRDEVDFEKFKKQEEAEMSSDNPNSQQLKKVGEMADYQIDNSGTLDDLYAQIEEKIKS